MIPIIFAISIVTFPYIIGQIFVNRGTTSVLWDLGTQLIEYFNPSNPGWLFIILYFLFVLGFSFFYVSITFNTDEVAENIQKRGGYIPSIRPGSETADFLSRVSGHLNLFGWAFLALIAVFPYLAQKVNAILVENNMPFLDIEPIDFIISGAGIIIVVGVVLELIRRVDSELKSYDYRRF